MSTTALISCSSKKLPTKARARELYVSALFTKSLRYAELQNPEKTFILSAKHGLLELEQEIEPYDETLNTMKKAERMKWAQGVLGKLEKIVNLQEERVIFLAGNRYREFLTPNIRHCEIPMKGMGIGEQLAYLNKYLGIKKA